MWCKEGKRYLIISGGSKKGIKKVWYGSEKWNKEKLGEEVKRGTKRSYRRETDKQIKGRRWKTEKATTEDGMKKMRQRRNQEEKKGDEER